MTRGGREWGDTVFVGVNAERGQFGNFRADSAPLFPRENGLRITERRPTALRNLADEEP